MEGQRVNARIVIINIKKNIIKEILKSTKLSKAKLEKMALALAIENELELNYMDCHTRSILN